MLWELEWGDQYQTLLDIQEASGVKPKALVDRPALQPQNRLFLEAFYDLNPSRQIGMTIGPIPCSEVLAYVQLLGDYTADERLRLLRIVRRLDSAYMEFNASQAKKTSP